MAEAPPTPSPAPLPPNEQAVRVSILIPVRNERANLPRCLDSVAWAAEVWVVDSQSTDGTLAYAESRGCRVVQFAFNGTWPKKKNWALENLPFAHDWVFILDADEVLPADAEAEIRAIVSNPAEAHAGYWINRRFMFMGGWLRHAYYPNWNLRLLRHAVGRYEMITGADTASGDNEVHEHLVVQGTTGRLRAQMDHHAFPDVATFVEKHNRYSNWEARVLLEGSLDDRALQSGVVGWRRRLKRWSRHLPCRPTLRFLYVYIFQCGFLDGRRGWYFARLHAVYELLSIAKAHELRLRAERDRSAQP